jgi:hypothetical protein
MGRNLHRSLIFASEEYARPSRPYAFYGFTVMGDSGLSRRRSKPGIPPVPAVRSTTVIRRACVKTRARFHTDLFCSLFAPSDRYRELFCSARLFAKIRGVFARPPPICDVADAIEATLRGSGRMPWKATRDWAITRSSRLCPLSPSTPLARDDRHRQRHRAVEPGPQLPESFAVVHRADVDSTSSTRRQENGLRKADQKRSEDLAGLVLRTER